VLLQNGWTLGSVYLLRLLQATIRLFHRRHEMLEKFLGTMEKANGGLQQT